MRFVVLPLPAVEAAKLVAHRAVAFSPRVHEVAVVVAIAHSVMHSAVALLHALAVRSSVHLTLVEHHGALAMGEIFRPLTVIHIAVRPDLLSVAVLLAVKPLAVVDRVLLDFGWLAVDGLEIELRRTIRVADRSVFG